jgi:hypothetical protein
MGFSNGLLIGLVPCVVVGLILELIAKQAGKVI